LELKPEEPDGAFHHVSRFHDERIGKIFTHEVFSLLIREKLIKMVRIWWGYVF